MLSICESMAFLNTMLMELVFSKMMGSIVHV